VKIRSWRLVHPHHVADAFSGEGARKYGGRWNSQGVPVIYTGGSLSLAALELLVHLGLYQVLENYVCIPVEFDDSLCRRLDHAQLPADWREDPAPPSTKEIGDSWVAGCESVVLAVPSVLAPQDDNFLLNPAHPDFKSLDIGHPQPFEYDPRLIKSSPV